MGIFFFLKRLTWGWRAVVGTVLGTTGDAAEGGTEPRTATAAANPAGRGKHKTSGGISLFDFYTFKVNVGLKLIFLICFKNDNI